MIIKKREKPLADIAREEYAVASAIKNANVQKEIGDDWKASKIYKEGEYVMDGNRLWICTIQNVNIRPSDNSLYWSKVNIASEFNRLAALINKEE